MAPVRDGCSVVLTGAFVVLFQWRRERGRRRSAILFRLLISAQGDDLGEGVRSVKHEYGNGRAGRTYEHRLHPANRQAGEGGLE